MTGASLALLAALQIQMFVPPRPVATTVDTSLAEGPALEGGGFFGPEAYLGLAVLGSLAIAQIEGVNEIDHVFGPQAVGRGRLSRSLPRFMGRGEIVAGLAGGLLLMGEATRNPGLRQSGWRSLESLAVNAIGTTALKILVGRARPGDGRDEDVFHPFSTMSNSWSFPSGHTSSAFALATAVSMELGPEHGWVPFVAYPVAAWVGVSRVVDERHWPTDVVAGAALGILSARLARTWFGNGESDGTPRLMPVTINTPDGVLVGVRLAVL